MTTIRITSMTHARRGIHPWLALVVLGCASTAGRSSAQESPGPALDPAMHPQVQVVGQPTTTPDGQTSWILEQDVRRTPKMPGGDSALPPHVERRMNYAFDLAQRGATYSATTEFQAVLGLCALELDSRSGGGSSHRDALRQGLIALDEADQFGGEQVDWRESADVRAVAAGHHTPVLNQPGQPPIDSIRAVQAYYAFAEERLAFACQGLPGASMAFYGLGRTITVPGMRVAHATGKAALYHRIALTVAPQNVLAANELGVLLAQHGELEGAEKLLQYCVAIEPSAESYRNLSIVYAQKGDQRASQQAQAAGEAIATRQRNQFAADNSAMIASQDAAKDAQASDEAQKPLAKEKFQAYLAKFQVSSLVPKVFRR